MKTVDEVIAFAESKLGKPYIFGANGQLITEAFILSKAKQYPKVYTPSYIERSMKWVKQPPVDGYDCSGLIDVALGVDYNAQGYYANATSKGKILLFSDMPDVRGVLLFKYSATQGKMTHVGIYIGNGETIEAMGVDYGVVKRKRSSSWTHWGYCHLIDYGNGETNTMIRLGSKGTEVVAWQTDLNTQGYGLVTDGIFGSKTETATKDFQAKYGLTADGIVGEQTLAKMASILNTVPVPPVVDYKAELDKAIAKINLLNVEIQNLKNQIVALEKQSQSRHDELTQVAMAFDVLSGIAERY